MTNSEQSEQIRNSRNKFGTVGTNSEIRNTTIRRKSNIGYDRFRGNATTNESICRSSPSISSQKTGVSVSNKNGFYARETSV